MSKLTISLACTCYDRTRAIFDGRVPVDGCEVISVAMSPEEAFHRAFEYQEFDVTELSMSSYMSQVSRGINAYVAIPAFVSRMFRHSSIYIRTDRGINAPEDLKGKTVGLPEYQMTAALWVRGILEDVYGVKPADMRWRCGGLEQAGRGQAVEIETPEGVELKRIPNDETLSQLLDQGGIDALISARAPSCYHGNDKITRLFPDYRTAEEDYYRETGMFPIMHLIGVRKSLVEAHPWLPANLYVAFLEAKRLCYANLEQVGHLYTTLPWPVYELERARELMGEDYWRYGVHENEKEIAAMTRYSFDQGLSVRKLGPEDLFAASTFELVKV
jgi:4,5-dihydroxyphthalate decarboxylase